MNDLVAFYEKEPVDLRGKVEIEQRPMSDAPQLQALEGAVRPKLVYVVRRNPVGRPWAIPVAAYDDWELRSRYNEALRVMNVLGASEVTGEALREVGKRSRFRLKVLNQGASGGLARVEGSTYDYHHQGAGRPPQDPGALMWPDEPGVRAAIHGVIANGATSVRFTIRTTNVVSANADLVATIKGVGLDIGMRRDTDRTTTLRVSATFPEPKRSRF